MTQLDESIHAALLVPRRYRMLAWYRSFLEHRSHSTFEVQSWPYTREYGFTCGCQEPKQAWRIGVTSLVDLVPEYRTRVQNSFQQRVNAGQKARRREAVRANHQSRALLHRYLTPLQRQELRATGSFRMQDRDARTYTLSKTSNLTLGSGEAVYTLCCHPVNSEELPFYDILLAQKIMIETDPEAFLRLAHATNESTKEHYDSAGIPILGDPPAPKQEELADEWVAELTNEVLENPRQWVAERLGLPPESPESQDA